MKGSGSLAPAKSSRRQLHYAKELANKSSVRINMFWFYLYIAKV